MRKDLFTYIDFCRLVESAGFKTLTEMLTTVGGIRKFKRALEAMKFDFETQSVHFAWKVTKTDYDPLSWDLLYTQTDKGGSHPVNKVALEWLLDCASDTADLRQRTVLMSLDNFMRSGYQDKRFVPVDPAVLATTATVWALTRPVDGANATVVHKGVTYRVSKDDRWLLSTSLYDFKAKCLVFLASAEKFYKYHGASFDTDEVMREVSAQYIDRESDLVTYVKEDRQYGRMMLTSTFQTFGYMYAGLRTLANEGRLHIYTGYAGTGKTTQAVQHHIHDDSWFVIALSNLVAMNGANKAMNYSGDAVAPCSIARYRYTFMNMTKEFDGNAMLDEFSQWSSAELEVLRDIVSACVKNGRELVVMGDTHQIPTFLGKGNLLHGLTIQFSSPAYLSNLTEVKRCADPMLKQAPIKYINGDEYALDPYIGTKQEFDKFLSSFSDPDKAIIVTGSNKNVEVLNLRCLGLWANRIAADDCTSGNRLAQPNIDEEASIWSNLRENEGRILDLMTYRRLPVMCAEQCQCLNYNRETGNKFIDKMNHIFVVNERAEAWYEHTRDGNGSPVVSISTETGKHATMRYSEFIRVFTLRWAINVNRAQGLEWDCAWVALDPVSSKTNYNLTSCREAMYVAMSRSLAELHILGDVPNPPRHKYYNNFAIEKLMYDNVW